MKVGVVLDYVFFRHDVRAFVQALGKLSQQRGIELVLLAKEQELEATQNLFAEQGYQVRAVREETNSSRAKTLQNLWQLLMKTPKSSNRYYYYRSLHRIWRIAEPGRRRKAMQMFRLQQLLPNWLSYDWLLARIPYRGQTEIHDIEAFLLFSDLNDHGLAARLAREKAGRNLIYLYSWDHPCKFLRFPRKGWKYLSWNQGLREDLAYFQRIAPQDIRVVGSTQLTYMKRFLEEGPGPSPYHFPYLYYAAAVSSPRVLNEERRIIEELSDYLTQHHPNMKVVFRPYPVLEDWSVYEELRKRPNVVFDDNFNYKAAQADGYQLAAEKYTKMHYAAGFFHLGTTMGLEACFTDTPAFLLNPEHFAQPGMEEAYHFVNQYQNRKYINLTQYPNVISTEKQLYQISDKLAAGQKAEYLPYNRAVSEAFPLKDLETIADQTLESLQALMPKSENR